MLRTIKRTNNRFFSQKKTKIVKQISTNSPERDLLILVYGFVAVLIVQEHMRMTYYLIQTNNHLLFGH